jgi:hypothetical protein
MRIAMIGSGISRLAAGWYFSRSHEVSLFEKEPRLGGAGAPSNCIFGSTEIVPKMGWLRGKSFVTFSTTSRSSFRHSGILTSVANWV